MPTVDRGGGRIRDRVERFLAEDHPERLSELRELQRRSCQRSSSPQADEVVRGDWRHGRQLPSGDAYPAHAAGCAQAAGDAAASNAGSSVFRLVSRSTGAATSSACCIVGLSGPEIGSRVTSYPNQMSWPRPWFTGYAHPGSGSWRWDSCRSWDRSPRTGSTWHWRPDSTTLRRSTSATSSRQASAHCRKTSRSPRHRERIETGRRTAPRIPCEERLSAFSPSTAPRSTCAMSAAWRESENRRGLPDGSPDRPGWPPT